MESLHLDYLSCLLSILSAVLVGRKLWFGLVVSIVNSLIICAIGFHTLQFGFIPANLFCIGINAFYMRSWLKDRPVKPRLQAQQTSHGVVADDPANIASLETCARKLGPANRQIQRRDRTRAPRHCNALLLAPSMMDG